MKRRLFLQASIASFVLGATSLTPLFANDGAITPLVLTEEEWRRRLNEKQFHVLREEGTERPRSSPLNDEKRQGVYVCAGCDLPLFESDKKYDSGTGWPSFWDAIANHTETKTDFKIFFPRTEYHCARCGGHQGHIFDDGPKPTGKRWCNNGVALKFLPTDQS
ncbi:MAG: peptide-methionine (R)-S-oxide reductase [Gammaproteobacteria bacterium]|nr:MAG: peptide-methionine (R)-S-oxide reductase [Gammaproteobacteria bacterium]